MNGESGVAPFRSNVAGTVSMVLSTGPNSGTNQWFVNLADNSPLDNSGSGGPFTVFAKVAGDGMTLFNAFNTLSIADFNPDVDDDGYSDGGPFAEYDQYDNFISGVPYLYNSGTGTVSLVVLEKATQVDYLGSSVITSVPSGGLTFIVRETHSSTPALNSSACHHRPPYDWGGATAWDS